MAVGDETPTPPAAAAVQRELNDNDLDPAAFLKSVRELSERRDREDTERFRQLEEEVRKQKEERAARRRGERGISIQCLAQQWIAGCCARAQVDGLLHKAATGLTKTLRKGGQADCNLFRTSSIHFSHQTDALDHT